MAHVAGASNPPEALFRLQWRGSHAALETSSTSRASVADAAIALHADYAAWSDHVLGHLDHDSVGREVSAKYRQSFAVDTVGAATVVRGYRRVLAGSGPRDPCVQAVRVALRLPG